MTERTKGGSARTAKDDGGRNPVSPERTQTADLARTVADATISAALGDTVTDVVMPAGEAQQTQPDIASLQRTGSPPAKELVSDPVLRALAIRIYNLVRRLLTSAAEALRPAKDGRPTSGREAGSDQPPQTDPDIEEVTKKVLVLAVRKFTSFRTETEFNTWLYRVTLNAALLHRRDRAARLGTSPRHQGASASRPAPAAPVGKSEAQSETPERETVRLVEQAIARLPDIYRDAFVLADIERLSHAEVAATLGLSLDVVKNRLHRARLLLGDALAPYLREGQPA
jgi:RNA polymerase sigma-70 factor (ECF subfamily)